MKTAFIFPAFISEYLGNEIQILESFSSNFHHFLQKASAITGDDYIGLSLDNVHYTEDELRSQMISYIFSCSLSDILIKKGLEPDFMAGYSMGLYAALYTGGAIDFNEGIRLIKQAFLISKSVIRGVNSGMGSIIGLTASEISELIQNNKIKAEIANTNSIHSHLITGSKDTVNHLLSSARDIGALNVSMLNVSTPYHSKLLDNTQYEFQQFISEFTTLQQSKYPIISAINQRMLTSKEEIGKELTSNLFKRINWMETFNKAISMGVGQFIECGAGKSLQKISRFIQGDFNIYPMNKIDKVIL